MHIIDSRVSEGIRKWYQDWMLPLHNENKEELKGMRETLGTLVDTMNQGKGGMTVARHSVRVINWALGAAGAAAVLIISHYWK
jgi:hypothetical protein